MEKGKGIVEQLFGVMSDSFFPISSSLSVEMFGCQKTGEGLETKQKEKMFTVFACKFWLCQKWNPISSICIFVTVVGPDTMNDNKISPKFQDAPLISSSGSKQLVLL